MNMAGFDDIAGQDHIKLFFKNSIAAGRLPHACMIAGDEGSGKKLIAKTAAMAVMCEKHEPCGVCRACRQVQSGNHPDVKFVIGSGKGIGVDDVRRELAGDAMIRPYSAAHKIYIVEDADKMTPQAQNALLKTIEEPPEYVMIILLCKNTEAFLPTIISRCVILNTRPLDDVTIKRVLVEKHGVADFEAGAAAAACGGSVGKALRLSSSDEFKELKETVISSVRGIDEANAGDIIDAVAAAAEYKSNPDEYFGLMKMFFKDILLIKAGAEDEISLKEERESLKRLSGRVSFEAVNDVICDIEKAQERVRANVNFNNATEALFISARQRFAGTRG